MLLSLELELFFQFCLSPLGHRYGRRFLAVVRVPVPTADTTNHRLGLKQRGACRKAGDVFPSLLAGGIIHCCVGSNSRTLARTAHDVDSFMPECQATNHITESSSSMPNRTRNRNRAVYRAGAPSGRSNMRPPRSTSPHGGGGGDDGGRCWRWRQRYGSRSPRRGPLSALPLHLFQGWLAQDLLPRARGAPWCFRKNLGKFWEFFLGGRRRAGGGSRHVVRTRAVFVASAPVFFSSCRVSCDKFCLL